MRNVNTRRAFAFLGIDTSSLGFLQVYGSFGVGGGWKLRKFIDQL